MGAELNPEERAALLADAPAAPAAAKPTAVVQRDFHQPLRMSSEVLDKLRTRIEELLPELQLELRAWLGPELLLSLGGLQEVSAERICAAWRPPYALARFDYAGQPGWISWQLGAAVAAAERQLGAEASGAERALTAVERMLVLRVLKRAAQVLVKPLGAELGELRAVVEPDDIGNWRHVSVPADPHRLCIALALDSGASQSQILVYLPGLKPPTEAAAPAAGAGVTPHLVDVRLELAAELASTELSLAQILSLEPGDVLPLDARAGSPLRLSVDGRPWCEAEVGARAGRVAVRFMEALRAADEG